MPDITIYNPEGQEIIWGDSSMTDGDEIIWGDSFASSN